MTLEQEIITWLDEQSDILQIHNVLGRKALLIGAGLGDLQNAIILEGTTLVFCRNLIGYLWNYGQLADGGDPLIALLEAAKKLVGPGNKPNCAALIEKARGADRRRALNPAAARDIPLQRPDRATHFTDRTQELAQLLADAQPGRVVTLCGPGGVGKSALAAEAAWQIEPARFPDGIIFHSFYGQPSLNIALEHIARSFGVDPQPTPASAALRALAGKRALLLLDGTEDAEDLAAVLAIRGECGVIVTSRRRRDAAAERQDVTPLPTGEAVSLLIACGGKSAARDATARRICELVGGLPLAVRLAGRYLAETGETAADYLDWLTAQPLDALDHGKRRRESVNVLLTRSLAQVGADANQVIAMFGMLAFAPVSRAVIEAAINIKQPSAGFFNLFKRLFTKQAKQQQIDIRTALNELVGYGLLIRDGDWHSVSHALIHAYSRERCPAPGEAAERLAAHYAQFAREQSERGLAGYARLDRERAHILRALETCGAQAKWNAVRDLVKAVYKYFDLRGYWTDYQAALDLNLRAARQLGDRKDEGWCVGQLGYLAKNRGEYAAALTYLEQSLAIRREIGNKAGEGTTLNNISQIYHARGDYAAALAYLEQSLAIRREIGNKAGEGTTLNNISLIYHHRGDLATALTYLEQSLAIRREIGDKAGEGVTLSNISLIYYDRGDLATALTYLEQSLAIRREIGDKAGEGTTLNNISLIYHDRGDLATALTYLEQSLAIQREIGDKAGEGVTLNNISLIYHDRGDLATALTYLEQSLAIRREIGNKAEEGVTCWNIGFIYKDQGDLVRAEEYISRTVQIDEEIGHPDLEKDRAALEQIRQALKSGQS